MIDLKEVLAEWAEDSRIGMKLDEDSRNTPLLHAKYLEKLANSKLLLKRAEFTQKVLLKQKWEWYNGKMDPETLKELGWDPDPFNGLKIMKAEDKWRKRYPHIADQIEKLDLRLKNIETYIESEVKNGRSNAKDNES